MNITKENHSKYIKPLIDETYNVVNRLHFEEKILIEDKLVKILQAEFEPEKLFALLNQFTPLQLDILKKHNLEERVSNAQNFLNIQ